VAGPSESVAAGLGVKGTHTGVAESAMALVAEVDAGLDYRRGQAGWVAVRGSRRCGGLGCAHARVACAAHAEPLLLRRTNAPHVHAGVAWTSSTRICNVTYTIVKTEAACKPALHDEAPARPLCTNMPGRAAHTYCFCSCPCFDKYPRLTACLTAPTLVPLQPACQGVHVVLSCSGLNLSEPVLVGGSVPQPLAS